MTINFIKRAHYFGIKIFKFKFREVRLHAKLKHVQKVCKNRQITKY